MHLSLHSWLIHCTRDQSLLSLLCCVGRDYTLQTKPETIYQQNTRCYNEAKTLHFETLTSTFAYILRYVTSSIVVSEIRFIAEQM